MGRIIYHGHLWKTLGRKLRRLYQSIFVSFLETAIILFENVTVLQPLNISLVPYFLLLISCETILTYTCICQLVPLKDFFKLYDNLHQANVGGFGSLTKNFCMVRTFFLKI